jgi:hypothetical protein
MISFSRFIFVASFCLFYTVEGSWESLAILVAVFLFKEHGRKRIADVFFIKLLLLDNGVLWYEDCVGYYWSPLVIYGIFAAGLDVHLFRNS